MIFSSTLFANDLMPRSEYPRPQFCRQNWINLNGDWEYCIDNAFVGKEKGFTNAVGFDTKIVVPFCPESSLSGVKHTDFINSMWYKKSISIPQNWNNKRILINFGGINYFSEVYIDGRFVKNHFGGSSSFTLDITDFVQAGKTHNLIVYVENDVRSKTQTAGKQSLRLNSYSCLYTRVTGIWQTVWLEGVDKSALKSCKISPDLDGKQFIFEPDFWESSKNNALQITISFNGKNVFKHRFIASNSTPCVAQLEKIFTWSPETPFLYDVKYELFDSNNKIIDIVSSYAGMRKVHIEGKLLYLNNKPYYQRLVLDQGYYPNGQWTAPMDNDLKNDIELGKAAGFNGARLHQKVFEPRYLYWADKLGYLTWGESASWGMDWTNPMAARNMIPEWVARIERDYNSPSLIAWSPLNETWQDDVNNNRYRLTNDLYEITKSVDKTRPIITVSGGYHCGFTDIYAEHTYEQNPVELYKLLANGEKGKPYVQFPDKSAPYNNEVYMIDEFGGIQWISANERNNFTIDKNSWGYGRPPQTIEDFYKRLESQVNVILSLDHIAGFCYTQIVDVELEKNGIYTYNRETKFDMSRIKGIFSKTREEAKTEIEIMNKSNK